MNSINTHTFTLADFMKSQSNGKGFTKDHGIYVQKGLIAEINKHPSIDIIYLSMKGIENISASFAREAIIKPAREFRCQKGFCLIDIENEEYLDNFIATVKLSQPIIVKLGDQYEFFGPNHPSGPSKGNKAALDYIWKYNSTTAPILSEKLDLKITNACTKLKQLLEQGFILRKQDPAASSGTEYIYYPIK